MALSPPHGAPPHGVDGRDKPGHDGEGGGWSLELTRCRNAMKRAGRSSDTRSSVIHWTVQGWMPKDGQTQALQKILREPGQERRMAT